MHAGMPTEAEAVAATKEGKGRDGQAPEKEKELLLAGNSAGSSKARNGGTVYDILVSEIKVGSFLCSCCHEQACTGISARCCRAFQLLHHWLLFANAPLLTHTHNIYIGGNIYR